MKKNAFFFLILSIIVLLTLPPDGLAKNGWVSDMLVLTFRQGPGNTYAVEKTLTSNTLVTILDDQNGFFKVELESGETGWVDNKFIIFDPPKAVLLEQALDKNRQLARQIEQLSRDIETQKEKISTSRSDFNDKLTPLENSLKQQVDENRQIKQDLEKAREKYNTLVKQSKNIQQIIEQNKQLTQTNKEISVQLKELEDKHRNLFKTAMIKWFLAGVGVLLLGWIIGQSVSSKKRRYGSLLD
jgi:SH3 domain protein